MRETHERLTQLSGRLSPSAVVGDLLTIDYDKARQDVTGFLSKHVRGNPLAFALIAAGIGWLLMSQAGEPVSRLRPGRTTRSRRRTKARPRRARKAVSSKRLAMS